MTSQNFSIAGILQRFNLALPVKAHPFAIPAITFVVLFFVTLTGYISSNGLTMGPSDSLIVHLSIDGDSQTIPTRASTVGELLVRMEIMVHEKDIVEPALESEITADDFRINIYKARPVFVIDGNEKIATVSAEQVPRKVAEAVGLTVYPEDIIEKQPHISEPNEILKDGIVAEKIIIQRATPASINLYGSTIDVRTHAATVSGLLREKNIVTSPEDTITPDPGTPLEPNAQIFIMRVGREVETQEELIAMPIETINDPNMIVGQKIIREKGRPGRKIVTYEIELQNDEEVARRVIQEIIAEESIKQVEIVGTKVVYSNPSANVALGQEIAAQMGWSHEFDCIYQIFQKESRWNHLAHNRRSGAYGIPQALPGSKMGPGWEHDPAVQIRWGINYMVNRYGSPCRAYNFWQVNKWY